MSSTLLMGDKDKNGEMTKLGEHRVRYMKHPVISASHTLDMLLKKLTLKNVKSLLF